jgi:hypothetical protein
MRTLIDPNSSCGFCGGYDLGTRCESCGAGSDNYDALGGEQGWIMKSKLNELRLDAGIARIENQQWLCVLDKETGMMIDPLIGLEKFAELIVGECIDKITTYDLVPGHSAKWEDIYDIHARLLQDLGEELKEHFGVTK